MHCVQLSPLTMAASSSMTWSMATLRAALPAVPSGPMSICLNISAVYNPSYSKPRDLRLCRQGAKPLLPQYSGLTALSPLLSVTGIISFHIINCICICFKMRSPFFQLGYIFFDQPTENENCGIKALVTSNLLSAFVTC